MGSTISLGLSHWASSTYTAANFYLLPSRAWELGVGALTALYLHHTRWAASNNVLASTIRALREAAAVLGLVLILYAVFVFDDSTPFPSLWALFPVVGTALIIVAADSQTFVGRLLSLRFLVGIGLISYSAYLWHQPLFSFARIRLFEGVPLWVYWVLITLSFALAWLTWLSIEVPARKRFNLPTYRILSGAVACSLLIASIGVVGFLNQGYKDSNNSVAALTAWQDNISPVRSECHARENFIIPPSDACIFNSGNGEGETIYVWGDSHGVELSYSIAMELQENYSSHLVQLTGSQCIPTPGVESNKESHCTEYNRRVSEFLFDISTPGIVILVARWPLYFVGSRVSHDNGCSEGNDFAGRSAVTPTSDDRMTALGEEVRQTINRLVDVGHKVMFVHAVPEPGCNVPDTLSRMAMFGTEENLKYPIHTHLKRQSEVLEHIQYAQNPEFSVYDPTDVFCKIGRKFCTVANSTGLLYFDSNHPSLYGASLMAEEVISELSELEWLRESTDVTRTEVTIE
ncbi:MAG: acyltransferase family protein [Pseudohongiellaceae bacterium]